MNTGLWLGLTVLVCCGIVLLFLFVVKPQLASGQWDGERWCAWTLVICGLAMFVGWYSDGKGKGISGDLGLLIGMLVFADGVRRLRKARKP